jgi:hypothetical protein
MKDSSNYRGDIAKKSLMILLGIEPDEAGFLSLIFCKDFKLN